LVQWAADAERDAEDCQPDRHTVYRVADSEDPGAIQEAALAGTTVEEAGFENVTTEAGRKKIVSHAESLVRSIISFPVRHMTTGLRPRPSGDLPLIGPSKTFPNLIVAAGHYRNGVLLAPVTAKIVSALVANQKPPVDLAPFLPNA
jgi:glycine oxidase